MRIWHLLHSFPPNSFGGTETYVATLAQAQREAGHRVRVVSSCAPEAAERPGEIDGVGISWWPDRGERSPAGESVGCRTWMRHAIATDRPDVAHVHHWHGLTSDLVAVLTEAGVETVVTLHDYYITCPMFFRVRDGQTVCAPDTPMHTCSECVAERYAVSAAFARHALHVRGAMLRGECRRAGRVLVLSDAQRDHLGAIAGFGGVACDVLPLPRPAVHARPAPPDSDAGGPIRIVTWGGLDRGKGLATVVAACEGLRTPERVVVEHYGRVLDEALRAELSAAARRARLEFRGPYTAEAHARFAGADVAVFVSNYEETHGFVVDEALALGLPVIVSDRGAPPSRVGDRGLVVPAADPPALCAVLQRCLDDPAHLRARRRADPAPSPTVAEHVRALEAIYTEVLDAEPRPR